MAQVDRALQRGLLQGYRLEEDSLATVRGRIRFDEQVRRRYGVAPPIEVRFDEFDDDITENRLLKAAIGRLGRLRLRASRSRWELARLQGTFERVRLVEFDPGSLPEVRWTRLNSRYRPAVELAKLILRATSLELGHGTASANGFLVDMNKVFEDFAVVALREALGVTAYEFPQGARKRKLRLDVAEAVRLEPDISWWQRGSCVFVGDLKYKKISGRGNTPSRSLPATGVRHRGRTSGRDGRSTRQERHQRRRITWSTPASDLRSHARSCRESEADPGRDPRRCYAHRCSSA